jgi:hypothetical protein
MMVVTTVKVSEPTERTLSDHSIESPAVNLLRLVKTILWLNRIFSNINQGRMKWNQGERTPQGDPRLYQWFRLTHRFYL